MIENLETKLNEYRGLAKETRQIATHFCIIDMMRELKVSKTSDFITALEGIASLKVNSARERRSNYWHLKFSKKPFSHKDKLENIAKHFSESFQLLFHPLWQILTSDSQHKKYLADKANSVCHSLKLAGANGEFTKKDINVLSKRNDLDALFALLFIQSEVGNAHHLSNQIATVAFNLFCRLMVITFPSRKITIKTLFREIASSFYFYHLKTDADKAANKSTLKQLSIQPTSFLNEVSDVSVFEFCCGLKALIKKLQSDKLKHISEQDMHRFLRVALEHDVAKLYYELDGRHKNNHLPIFNEIMKATSF